MNADQLKDRTKQFGLRIIHLVDVLPTAKTAQVLGNQMLRSGTSVGANYRSACRARSRPGFVSKAGIALEEADESLYWIELLAEAKIVLVKSLHELRSEGDQLVRILTPSVKTARANLHS